MQTNTELAATHMDIKPHLDWYLCLQLAGNKPLLAKEILIMFMEELPITHTNIIQAYKAKDYKVLHNHVHKLHGASCYCGVPSLKAILAEIEYTLKTKHVERLTRLMALMDNEIQMINREFKELDLAKI